MTARWRNEPSNSGLRSVGQAPRGLELRENGKLLIKVAPLGGGALRGEVRGWYWYGLGQNTSSAPKATMEEAKVEATSFYKNWHAEGRTN